MQKGGKNDNYNYKCDFINWWTDCHSDGVECSSRTRLPYGSEEYCISIITDRRCVEQDKRMSEFYEGEYIIYRNGEKYELGRITSLREDGAFVCYHEGETAAKTPYDHMHKLVNAYTVKVTSLGGSRFQKGGNNDPVVQRLQI